MTTIYRSLNSFFFNRTVSENSNKICAAVLLPLLLITGGCGKMSPEEENAHIQKQIEIANQYNDNGKASRAIEFLEGLSKQHPNHPDILETLAFSYLKLPNPKLAAFYFERVIFLKPERSDLLPYAGKSYINAGDWKSAEKAYSDYLRSAPNSPHILKALFEIHANLNEPEKAIADFRKFSRQPNFKAKESELLILAEQYRKINQLEESFNQYTNIYRASDGTAAAKETAITAMLEIAIETNNREDALKLYSVLKQNHPEKSLSEEYQAELDKFDEELKAKAELLKQEKERKEAERKLAEAKRKEAELIAKKKKAEEEKKKAEELAKLNEEKAKKEAEQVAEKAVMVKKVELAKPIQLTTEELIAEAAKLRVAGKSADAVKAAWKAVNQSPNNGNAWHSLALGYFDNKESFKAENTVLEAMRIQPDNVLFRITYLKIIQSNYSAGKLVRELEKAHKDFPESPDFTLSLAKAYDEVMNSKREALLYYMKFLEKYPKHPLNETAKAAVRTLNNSYKNYIESPFSE